MGKKYRSNLLAAVHETALGLTEAGVMDKRTMKAFDEMCLTPVEELTAEQIRQIRLAREGEPGRVCALPQRHHRACQPVGARRETSTWRLAQAAHTSRQEGTAGSCVNRLAALVVAGSTTRALAAESVQSTRMLRGRGFRAPPRFPGSEDAEGSRLPRREP